jgi:multidrug efflux pump subunit AcrA (membrane-fusion protein)
MFARVRVLAGPPGEAMLVPAVAIGSDQGNKFVLLVNKESVVEPRPVEIERQHGSLRVVTQGLTLEDRVIVNGLMMARPGTKVEVVNPPSSQAAPSPTPAQR